MQIFAGHTTFLRRNSLVCVHILEMSVSSDVQRWKSTPNDSLKNKTFLILFYGFIHRKLIYNYYINNTKPLLVITSDCRVNVYLTSQKTKLIL